MTVDRWASWRRVFGGKQPDILRSGQSSLEDAPNQPLFSVSSPTPRDLGSESEQSPGANQGIKNFSDGREFSPLCET